MQTQLYLTPADQGRELTMEEFDRAGALKGYRYELIDGKLEVSPEPDLPHEDVCDWLETILRDYAREHPEVVNRVSSHARVYVAGRRAATCPQPDLAVYHNFPGHLPRRMLRWQDVSPVLVIEVLSEDNAEKDLVRNLEIYAFVTSIREYWILDPLTDPDRPTLTVHRRRGQGWQKPIVVGPGGSYTTRLLPGLELRIEKPES
jgi:Uma2 family endonuclease